jgi:hypothetical protein
VTALPDASARQPAADTCRIIDTLPEAAVDHVRQRVRMFHRGHGTIPGRCIRE